MQIPTWELAKEIADKLPGGKGEDKDQSKEPRCENCGTPYDENMKKDKNER